MRTRLGAVGAGLLTTIGLVAGCGGGNERSAADAVPAAVAAAPAPAVSAPTAPGDVVRPGPGTPAPFAAAIRAGRPVVAAFLMPGVADDESVREALRVARSSSQLARGVRVFVYDLSGPGRFGDLPELLGVTGTPSVAVIGRDRRLSNLFRGLVDADLLRQAISDAAAAPPAVAGARASSRRTRPSPAALALSRKVEAAYAGVEGLEVRVRSSLGGAAVEGTIAVALRKGYVVADVSGGGARLLIVADRTRAYAKPPGRSCWVTQAPDEALPVDPGTGPLPPGTGLSGPRREGRYLVVTQTQAIGGRPVTVEHRIDPATYRLVSSRAAGGRLTMTYTARATAPERPPTAPLC
jgi:hypothetical protein